MGSNCSPSTHAVQFAHARSDDVVQFFVTYWDALRGVMSSHTRLEYVV